MYPHTREGFRQFPGLSLYRTVADFTSNGTFDLARSGTFGADTNILFSDDGTKIYYTDNVGSDISIRERSLSTAWDITTAGSATTYDTGFNSGSVAGAYDRYRLVAFKTDGTRVYLGIRRFNNSSSRSQFVAQFDLSTPWDISTASYDDVLFLETGSSFDFYYSMRRDDGSSFYVTSSGNPGTITQWDLSTSWDITSGTVTANTGSVNTAIDFFHVLDGGASLWGQSGSSGDLYQYALSTSFDLSTLSFVSSFSPDNTGETAGLYVKSDGSALYTVRPPTNDTATQYEFGGTGRGAIAMSGMFYAVVDANLFSVTSAGVTTNLGTIAGSDRVVMDTDGTQLVISTGSDGGASYVYTTAGGLVTITDPDFTDTAKSNAYLDLRFWFDQGGQFRASEEDDATSFDALDVATAESFADDILREFAHNQRLYHFGGNSIEVDRTGTGRPPSDRQAVIERGIVGTHAVDSIDDTIFFVDQFRRPNMMSGLQYQPIYTPAIAEAWDAYTTDSDCIVQAYSYRQQTFVDFIFPTDDASWTYHVESGKWCEREDSSNNRFRAISYVNVYDKLLALDRSNAKIYEFSETTYQDDGSSITRTLHTERVSPELVGLDTRMITVDGLWLTIESTGAATVSVSFARNGGAFETAKSITVSAGVKTYPLAVPWGPCAEGQFQITTTGNAGIDFIDAMVEVNPLGV